MATKSKPSKKAKKPGKKPAKFSPPVGGDKPPPLFNGTTHLSFILDKSGSMEAVRGDAIGGFNAYLSEVQGTAKNTTFTLTLFDTSFTLVHDAIPLGQAKPLTPDTYAPSGWTALLDAVGKTILALDKALGKDDRALVVIYTDGHENSSREFTQPQIRKMIEERQKSGRWTFLFLGAHADAWDQGSGLGISCANVVRAQAGNVKGTMRAVGASNAAYCSSHMRASANLRDDTGTQSAFSDAGAEVMDPSAPPPAKKAKKVRSTSIGSQLPPTPTT